LHLGGNGFGNTSGHHSAAFTLATYVHLLDGDIGGPPALSVAPTQRDGTTVAELEMAA